MTALELAHLFHEAYERLAPSKGYETRKETRSFDPESPNGKLMVAVCAELLPLVQRTDEERSRAAAVAVAAVRYDDAIRASANDPEKMSTYCTAQGDDLDKLYEDWMKLAREYLFGEDH